jgi:AraC-like DNA-binding protein
MISMRALFGPLAYARAAGLDAIALLRGVDVDPQLIGDVDAFVPLAAAGRLFEKLAAATGEPLVGLRAAQHVGPAAFDLLRYTGASSPSFGDALRQLVRWFPVLNTAARAQLSTVGGAARLACTSGPLSLVGSQSGEYVIACTLWGLREIVRDPLRPLRIELRHRRHAPDADYRRILDCPVTFDLGEDAIVFPVEVLVLPTRQPDPTLNALLGRHLQEVEKRRPKTERFVDQVEHAIVAELGQGPLTMARAARRLGTSARTLQRRLAGERTTFRRVLDGIRENLARSYLGTPGVTIAEVAFLLGFADVPTFHRAFRGWTGQTPGAYSVAR